MVTSLEKAIWNWLDTYPDEFKDLQKRPNAELSTNCEKLFEHLDQFYEKQKGKAQYIWPLQTMVIFFLIIIIIIKSNRIQFISLSCLCFAR